MRPVDLPLAVRLIEHRRSPLPLPQQLRTQLHPLRSVNGDVIGSQIVRRDARLDGRGEIVFPFSSKGGGAAGIDHLLARGGETVEGRLQHLGRFLGGDGALRDQLLGEALTYGWMLCDGGVHPRLGEGRLIALVVAPATVADEIDQEVLAELLPIGDGQPRHGEAGERIVGVDVHHRNLESLGEVARVERGAGIADVGGEPDLIVDDDVDGAASGVAGRPEKLRVSATMPCPGNAASPWRRIAIARLRSCGGGPGWLQSSWEARVIPSTTGLTNSR